MLKTVAVFGNCVVVGMPEDAFSLRAQHFAGNGASLQGELGVTHGKLIMERE
jgi:hypothetical protein